MLVVILQYYNLINYFKYFHNYFNSISFNMIFILIQINHEHIYNYIHFYNSLMKNKNIIQF